MRSRNSSKPVQARATCRGGRGWTLSVALAALLSLAFATLASASGALTRAGAQPPVNTQPPRITGKAQEGQILRADQGSWRGPERKHNKFAFQWRLCGSAGTSCTDITKANDRIYPLRRVDVGHTLRVVVTATGQNGSASAPSTQTALVSAAPSGAPVATVRPTIEGKTEQGTVLTAQEGDWAGNTPVRIGYQWRRCGPQGGACQVISHLAPTAKNYTVRPADIGKTVRVLVTEQNQAGTSAALSDPTAKVTASPASATAPKNTAPPTITGSAQRGRTLSGTDRDVERNDPDQLLVQMAALCCGRWLPLHRRGAAAVVQRARSRCRPHLACPGDGKELSRYGLDPLSPHGRGRRIAGKSSSAEGHQPAHNHRLRRTGEHAEDLER